MTQITLDNTLPLPEVSRDNYQCWEEMLSVQVDMISGRRVVEARGKVWKVRYSYDYMGNAAMRAALEILRSGAPFVATVLPDNSDETVTSTFIVEELKPPTMAFSRRDNSFWHNISFTLREERPHERTQGRQRGARPPGRANSIETFCRR